ncbi:lipoprotein bor [Pseudoalteromonas rubra]|uniref:Lipoprotein bor n=1 Tax=Pseudoalteromonas rubra TaxID=43658 RepID=A0A5S3WFT3_9GAMM|nr:Bor family protein [Pseudoalteromonas rubra]TMP25129.1 lipoprotein bor [Pseudoalteromonas rubra]TMP28346.1 lipoprotein bor [Pseudoalteromonas rubra]
MKHIILSSLVTIALSGCAAQTFNINAANNTDTKTPTVQHSQHFFISGLGQEEITNASEICGGAENIVKVEAQHTFINGLLGAITFGIYTPRDAKVYCKA